MATPTSQEGGVGAGTGKEAVQDLSNLSTSVSSSSSSGMLRSMSLPRPIASSISSLVFFRDSICQGGIFPHVTTHLQRFNVINVTDSYSPRNRPPLKTTSFPFPVNMPDAIHIHSRLPGKHWPEAGHMILAHWLASRPDPLGQNLTQSA